VSRNASTTGLPGHDGGYLAVIVDLDVVINSADLHAGAWRMLFEAALPMIAGRDDLPPFSNDDYFAHVDGQPQEDGVRAFLASRNLRVPEGHRTDPPQALTVHGLAARKRQLFSEAIAAHGVSPYPSTVALLRELHDREIALGLATASHNIHSILAGAGLDDLFDAAVDGGDIDALDLPGKPAPDLFVEVAHRLTVPPRRSVLIEDSPDGVSAAVAGGFGRVVGIDRGGNRTRLTSAGATVVVADLAGLDVTAAAIEPATPRAGADLDAGPWRLAFDSYDPSVEGVRETLCTLANGYWATRGAAPHATAGEVHYPGTYIAGVYNRLDSYVAGMDLRDESLVNVPNWLPLTLTQADGTPVDPDHGTLQAYRQELDLRSGVLERTYVHGDNAGRATRVTERRIVSCADHHVAAQETVIEALNWAGTMRVRATLDADVANVGVAEYRNMASKHLEPVTAMPTGPGTVLLETRTSQSGLHVALAARTRAHTGGEPLDAPSREVASGGVVIGHDLEIDLVPGRSVTVEKVVAVATSRDRAISTPAEAARFRLRRASDFTTLLAAHERAWSALWDAFAVRVAAGSQIGLALHLHTFHVLQTVVGADAELDAGIGARGLHGEGYRGHVFWDETFVYPMLTLRWPELTRDLLTYRHRRLPAARAAASAAGLPGALFPWQSGSDGRDVTPAYTLNVRSGDWFVDHSHRQRHIGLAIAYSTIQYYQATADIRFLTEMGAELLIEICRFFEAISTYDESDDRFHIDGAMGPDEFHDGYPGHDGEGLRDNAYTNILAAWLLHRTIALLDLIDRHDQGRLRQRLQVTSAETVHWERVSRRLAVPMHADGVISQFDGYERLPEFDWSGYRDRYGNIERLDLILLAEGDSTNRYRISKQADVLMLFYLLSAEELRDVLDRLGYPLPAGAIRDTVDFYTARCSHGSTLSRVVHAWVNARADRQRAWTLFTDALQTDMADRAGDTTREGVHLGAMAGTVDLVLRCFTGLETRDDALWLHPVLPPELPGVEFTIVYRGQQIRIELARHLLRLRLSMCDAHPITVCIDGNWVVLRPGDVYESHLEPPGLA